MSWGPAITKNYLRVIQRKIVKQEIKNCCSNILYSL